MGIPGVPTVVLWRNSREDWQTFTVSYSTRGVLLTPPHQLPCTHLCAAGVGAEGKDL